jgi:hypothetical protein
MGTTRTAVPASSSALKELTKAVQAITALGTTLNTAMFGRWDDEKNEKIPGVVDQVRGVVDQVKAIDARLDTRDKREKWIYAGAAFLLCIGAASSVGVPTQQVGHAIAQQFWQIVLSHYTPAP